MFLLNMCYDVPVKLMSGHLLLMALLLIAPDSERLFRFFVLGRPITPAPEAPLFGQWQWLNKAGSVLRTILYVSFASLTLYQAYISAKTEGILAPERPANGRWIATSFARGDDEVPLAVLPDDSPPKQFTPSKWRGGPGLPPVAQIIVKAPGVAIIFADGSRTGFRRAGRDDSELVLVSFIDGERVAEFQVSIPGPDVLRLEGQVGGEKVRITLRKPREQKNYPLKQRSFQWVQEAPFNR